MPATRKSPSIGVLSNHVGFHLRLAQLAVFENIGRAMKDIDVTPAIFSVLEVLHENDGITQSRLAAAVPLPPLLWSSFFGLSSLAFLLWPSTWSFSVSSRLPPCPASDRRWRTAWPRG